MGEGPEEQLDALGGRPAGAERVAGAPLLPTEAALDLPALAVALAVGAPGQAPRPPAPRGRRDPPRPAPVHGDQRVGAERGAERVVALGVVARVGEHEAERHARGGAAHHGAEQRRVVGRAACGERGEHHLRGDVAADGELGVPAGVARAAPAAVVDAAVRQRVARAVDGDRAGRRRRGRAEEAGRARGADGGVLEGGQAPPFSSRRAA